jgi:pimeloyl-ACP methyl ester carboxylesterase
VELLRASHAESSRGLVDDLNLVLGKRPWGFDYTDLGVACEVWHGSKDEKIALSSSVSLAREMRDCQLHVVEGASHSLMTNSSVVMQVFESIVKHWQAVSPSGAR